MSVLHPMNTGLTKFSKMRDCIGMQLYHTAAGEIRLIPLCRERNILCTASSW
jgi:hypothetical protein